MTRAGVLLIMAALLATCEGNGMSFDRDAWAAEPGNRDRISRRGEMVAAAAEAGGRVGATRAEVRALLGAPESSGADGDVYYLGRSAFGPSHESLEILYSPAGVVTQTQFRRD